MKNLQKTTILKEWIETNCLVLWSLLNNRSQQTLPQGLMDVAKNEGFEVFLKRIEDILRELEGMCGSKSLGDSYRRDLSNVNFENQVYDFFYEIFVCCRLGKISDDKKLTLRPPTGKGTHSDCLIKVNGLNIYAEVKNYPDVWPPPDGNPHQRSLCKSKPNEKPQDIARPRSIDLRSKLNDVHRQFPDKNINLLFIFEHSCADSRRHLTQAFYGDANLWTNENYILHEEGLFNKEEWRNISACCLSYYNVIDSKIVFEYFWKNPRAYSELPKIVMDVVNGGTVFQPVQKMV